ncbi:HesA/MoeB/ThiF family protein [Cobetia amphilecti]|uniref:HesA/MoeB/ThiF family protein n=1 Tax=Cobetia amphilecti TaxID=1055104 RepID=UPI00254B294F|nr:molybdopterin-synthase adenylyltransferase MoeB [Cobetia amphilecti]
MQDSQLLRYSRQILLPQVDIAGQQRLLAARVLVIGAGGLGCPAALYLAAAGIGTLVVADDDHVELSNLQRQIAHGDADIDQPKAQSLAASLLAINPDTEVIALSERLEGEALAEQVAAADVVLDCTDRFSSRFPINAACVTAGTPLVSGAAIRFSGQLAVFDRRDPEAPCYGCLYPLDELGDEELTCAESGVIAPLVGIIGAFQALEALKLISGAGSVHRGLATFDGLTGEWRRMGLKRDPGCQVCGGREPA